MTMDGEINDLVDWPVIRWEYIFSNHTCVSRGPTGVNRKGSVTINLGE